MVGMTIKKVFWLSPSGFPGPYLLLALSVLDGNLKCFHRQLSEKGILKHLHHYGGHSTNPSQL